MMNEQHRRQLIAESEYAINHSFEMIMLYLNDSLYFDEKDSIESNMYELKECLKIITEYSNRIVIFCKAIEGLLNG